MQPNPGDTTNALMVQLIQIIATSNVPDISNLSSATNYASSMVWMQTLAYASLAFSVLAAFGAVMGKQWLNSYKAALARGSLEERGLRRQRKLDGLERWQLQAVLGAFLVLLQISLFLFGLSLSARVWTQSPKMSSIIICTTAFGVIFYWGTILVSLWYPDSPFQSPGSRFVGGVWRRIRAVKSTLTNKNNKERSPAICWVLETSTNADVVEAAAAMIPLAQWKTKLDVSAIYERLLDTFRAHRHRSELRVNCGKAMAHLCSQSVHIDPALLQRDDEEIQELLGGRSRFIHDAFVAGRSAWHRFTLAKEHGDKHKHGDSAWDQDMMAKENRDKMKHKANARTALRTMVVHGKKDCLSLPDDEDVVWNGDLQWWRHNDQHAPGCEEFDWLIGYLNEEEADNQTAGDALLALSAMHGLGSPSQQASYIRALIRFMSPTRPPRVQHAAIRAISDAREEVSSITSNSMPQGVDTKLLDELSCALVSVVRQNDDQVLHDSNVFRINRDLRYIRLIFSLVQNDEWRQRLIRDGHIQWCISLVGGPLHYYLVEIFAHIDPSVDLPFSPASVRSRPSMSEAWVQVYRLLRKGQIILDEALPAFVTATRQSFLGPDNDVTNDEFQALAGHVQDVLVALQSPKTSLNGQVVDAELLSSMQRLYDDLSCMFEHTNDSQSDDGLMGSKEKY
jgi:hypothetical protein